MSEIARHWRILAGGAAAGALGVLGFAGVTASAQPAAPEPPLPAPATVTQTVTVAPTAAAPQAVGQQAVGQQAAPATGPAAVPAGVTATAPPAVPAVPAPPPVTITPATSGTITEYLTEAGVTLEPQTSHDFRALNIVLPMPPGWEHIPDPNVPDAFAVIADRVGGNGLHSSNAQVVVYKLIGQFDPREAIRHGFVDSQQLPAWRSTKASLADYGGMPSSMIEGTYRENALTLNTSRRHVVATSGPEQYLVSLSVTTSVDQVVPAAGATEAIIQGFKVSAPSAAPAVPPAAAPAATPATPAVPAAPAATPATPAVPAAPAATPVAQPAVAPAPGTNRRTHRILWRMLVTAVLCLCAAFATAAQGVWSLTRPPSADYVRRVLRGVAPIQLAAGVMLATGGLVALSASPPTSVVVLIVCVVGAVGTVAAGCWQSAKAVLREEQRNKVADGTSAGCGGACATCTLTCESADESVSAEVDRMGR